MNRSVVKTGGLNAFDEYLAMQRAQLPPLPRVANVSSSVLRVLGGNPGEFQLQGTNTYLVGTGLSRILIDTGEGSPIWITTILEVLQRCGIAISHVLLTHWHADHTGGVSDLLKSLPALSSSIFKNNPDAGQNPIFDGQTFSVEGATIKAVFCPGHSNDHMCFVLEEENALFTGDNVLGHGYTVVEDLASYMASLSKMQRQHCSVAYPGHGAVIEKLPVVLQSYISHRSRRERQVILALKNATQQGGRGSQRLARVTLNELVRLVYGRFVSPEVEEKVLRPSILEILLKLATDGAVGFELGGSVQIVQRWFLKSSGLPSSSLNQCEH